MWEGSRFEQYNALTMVETNDVAFRSLLLGQCILAVLRVVCYWFIASFLSKVYCCPNKIGYACCRGQLQSMIGWQGYLTSSSCLKLRPICWTLHALGHLMKSDWSYSPAMISSNFCPLLFISLTFSWDEERIPSKKPCATKTLYQFLFPGKPN